MALPTKPYKGSRDFYPEDKRLQKYIFKIWRKVVENFGYEEYDSPLIEPIELYSSKTSDEIVNDQTYVFTDRGDRKVAIRPEMTPSVSRMVAAKRQELPYPLRWYSIPNLWRYERPQRGRLREHWQLNVDVFGLPGIEAEHEIILLADSIMREFGAKRDNYTIKLNSRQLIDSLLIEVLGLDKSQAHSMRGLIDRMHKIGQPEFSARMEALLHPAQRDEGAAQKLRDFLSVKDLSELPEDIKSHKSVLTLSQLTDMLRDSFVTNIEYDPTLMRGFDYYTDIVFEIFDKHPENNRSMFGGGRYDGLVGLFGVEPVPTVGFGMGDVTFQNFLETHKLLLKSRPTTDIYVVVIGDVYSKAQRSIAELREMGVNVAVDASGRKLDKQIKAADKKGINYVMFIGEAELEKDQFNLKNLSTGKEEKHSLQRIVSVVKDHRSA